LEAILFFDTAVLHTVQTTNKKVPISSPESTRGD
jgi:hypothetical protein